MLNPRPSRFVEHNSCSEVKAFQAQQVMPNGLFIERAPIYLHEPCELLDGEKRKPDQPTEEFEIHLAELSGGDHLVQRLSRKRGPWEVWCLCHHGRSRSLPLKPEPIPLGNSRGR